MNESLTISQIARRAGVNIQTVRFYERRGLLERPKKPPSGFRCYGEQAVARIRFIKRAQELGFTLNEVGRLLTLQGKQSCQKTRALAAEKLELVEVRLADLNRLRQVLKELISQCDVTRGKAACPVITALTSRQDY
jgi:MerR family transcriptional regulator, mercuric resistance operon regulatory protein